MAKRCPTIEQATQFVHGELDTPRADAIRLHLDDCARCAQSVHWLQMTIALMRSDDAPSPSPAAMMRARALFDTSGPRRVRQPSILERIRAVLVFDSRLQASAAGVRGASPAHHLLFNAGDLDVDLQLLAADRRRGWTITGQVLQTGSDGAGAEATVELTNDLAQHHVQADTFGEFLFEGIAPGTYRLVIQTGGREVEIADLVTDIPAH